MREKKFFAVLLVFLFIFTLAACDKTIECEDGTTLQDGLCVVVTNSAPVLSGLKDVSLFVGDAFNPLNGVSASDAEDGNITSSILVDSNVNMNQAGIYNVTYSVADSGGKTTSDSITVTVVQPNSDPAIIGVVDQSIIIGTDFDPMDGVSASDAEDGNLTADIVVSGSVDTNTLGDYQLTYTVSDSDGVQAQVSATISVVPVPDTEAPTLFGVKDVDIINGNDFDPTWIFATDNITATDDLVFTYDTDLDTTENGVYNVTVSVSDEAGNVTTATFIVTVRDYNETELLILQDLNAINLDPDQLVLPSSGSINGSVLIWSSSNTDVVKTDGTVIPPFVGKDPVTVTLTVKGFKAGNNVSKTIDLTIDPFPEAVVTSSELLDFQGTSNEYIVPNKTDMTVFFVNDGNIPYMDIETFLNMVSGAIEAEWLNYSFENDILTINYDYIYEDIDGNQVTEPLWADINFDDNTVTTNDIGFFSAYESSTESDYGEGLIYDDVISNPGGEFTYDLGAYNIDLTIYNDGTTDYYLMPVAIENFLFLGNIYYNVYYNGDKLYGVDTMSLVGSAPADLQIQRMIRLSSYNAKDIPEDVRWATLNDLAFSLDYFYGLKDYQKVDTYYDLYMKYAKLFLTADDQTFYKKLHDIAYGLDDLHSWHIFTGFYEAPYDYTLTLNDLGPESQAYYNNMWAIEDEIYSEYGSRDYESDLANVDLLNNNTIAVIHLTEFTIDTPDEFKADLDGLPDTVKDVVIDLAYNGGGNVGAVFRIFGYMTEQPFMYHSQNPVDGSTQTTIMESDYVAYDYNWYIVTSSVTFSAANLMTSMAKEQGIATILGQPSSGGACALGAIILPDGTAIMVSSPYMLSTRVGNETDGYQYLDIEDGITPDYEMQHVYDYDELVTLIEQIEAK